MASLLQKWFGEDDRAAWLVFCGVLCVFAGAAMGVSGTIFGTENHLSTIELLGFGFGALGFNRWAAMIERKNNPTHG